jgi:hypothetical protein
LAVEMEETLVSKMVEQMAGPMESWMAVERDERWVAQTDAPKAVPSAASTECTTVARSAPHSVG